MIGKQRFSPGMQLSVLMVSFGVCYLVSGIVVIAIASGYLHQPLDMLMKNPKSIEANTSLSKLLQVVGTFFMFGLPALVFAVIVNKQKPFKVLGFNNVLSGRQFLYVILIMACAIWVGEAVALLNKYIPLPADKEKYFNGLEEEYLKYALNMLDFSSFGGYLASIFIIALLPAVLEELLFRGCLQKVMYGLSKHTFLSIFITSIIFSYIHMSYYGFLPRLFLGIVLGYLYHYSKNIWLNITAHFLNNAVSITFMYILAQKSKTVREAVENSDFTGRLSPLVILLGGLVLTAVIVELIKLFKKESDKVLAAHPIEDIEPAGNDTNNVL